MCEGKYAMGKSRVMEKTLEQASGGVLVHIDRDTASSRVIWSSRWSSILS